VTDPLPTPFVENDWHPKPTWTCKGDELAAPGGAQWCCKPGDEPSLVPQWCQTTTPPYTTPPVTQTYTVPTTPAYTTTPPASTITVTVVQHEPTLPVTGASAGGYAVAGLLIMVFGIAMLVVAKLRTR
jgi:hypothetical protein